MLSRAQLRMARAALNWGLKELAAKAGVGVNTIGRFENGGVAYSDTLHKIEAALEAEGVRFGKDEDGSVWVRLRPEAQER